MTIRPKRRTANGESGQILILTAISMVALLGIAALSLDASYMYDKRNRLHAAADAAAKSAATEVHRQGTSVPLSTLQTFANQQVTAHGFNPAGSTSVVVHHGPTSGPYTGNLNYVEVYVSEPTSTFFGVILGWTSMTPGARAVAGTGPGADCIITLGGPTASPESFSVGNSTVNMPGCSVADNGDFAGTNPNATINAQSVGVVGACISNCTHISNMQTGVPPASDPLSFLTPPTVAGLCTPVSVGNNATLSITANRCYSSITLGNNSRLYLGPGIYKVTGLITTGNNPHICLNAACTLDYSNGVMIYLTGAGQVNLPNGTTMVLNAMTTGTYNGILFYQDPSDTNFAHFRNGSSDYNLSGAMYFPSADVEFGNASSANDCSLFVAKSLTLNNGTSQLANTCSQYGGSPILTVSIAE